MANLLFYDKNHVYELNGIKLPSVSEILRFISREVYSDINQYKLDNAAERGKNVHKACEQLICFGECEVSDDLFGYIQAFVKFLKENECEFSLVEKSLATNEFAGTLDLYGKVSNELTIIDIKTVSSVNKPLVRAQLNGYKILAEHNGHKVEALKCLQLMSDGKYRLYPVTIDDTEFMASLTLHKALNKKFERGII